MTFHYNAELDLYQVQESRLASTIAPGPCVTNSIDWIAWHFTGIAFLPQIVASGALLCDSAANQSVILGNGDIKTRRRNTPIRLNDYPPSSVGDHVPFYFTPRSPTSYNVLRNTAEASDLVFLGVHVRNIADKTTWCATDGNAVMAMTAFTRDPDQIGAHVDHELLCAQRWPDPTGQDGDRTRRRHAELLVHQRVPLELVTHVVCYDQAQLADVRDQFKTVSGLRQYAVDKYMFMT